jgi:hypothetical protein
VLNSICFEVEPDASLMAVNEQVPAGAWSSFRFDGGRMSVALAEVGQGSRAEMLTSSRCGPAVVDHLVGEREQLHAWFAPSRRRANSRHVDLASKTFLLGRAGRSCRNSLRGEVYPVVVLSTSNLIMQLYGTFDAQLGAIRAWGNKEVPHKKACEVSLRTES